ncbi:ATP-dependent DNA helicase pfh1-like [Neodiprion fabricii]|uniref:ATP-dependent DNA helicase pfh1-like n=1 Tax=Neodiprion fabricii TaxID=2872261 RepID=UPI001ED8E8CC|nr:ATP-dependent DNA helicase pfh1-like [Neodiprion fabricii]
MDDKSTDRKREKCFYIDGSGGTGKTFLYNALYYMLKSEKKNVACVAWTGIAAILLPYGTTAHKTFGLPLTLQEEGTIFTNATMKKKIQSIDVFIWDECSMIPKIALELIDRTLKDIMEDALPFGGKTIILGGDFRQVLPIVKRGGKQQIIEETIKYSTLWSIFEKLSLKKNMRAKEDAAKFSEWLLNIGIDTADAALDEEAILRYPMEYLNGLTPSSLPPHNLQLKVGAIVMSLRNLSISDGLCNGTRLVVREIHSRILIGELLIGERKGQIVEIPRMKLDTRGDTDMPFILHRRQFPVRATLGAIVRYNAEDQVDRNPIPTKH